MSRNAPCPQCKQAASLDPANRFRPFCSERCKLLDLGEWMTGRYAIPVAEDEPASEDSAPGADPLQDRDRLQ
jgi:uncharacterized protein